MQTPDWNSHAEQPEAQPEAQPEEQQSKQGDPHPPMDVARLRRQLRDRQIGRQVIYAPSLPSTMPPAHAAMRGAGPEDWAATGLDALDAQLEATRGESRHGLVILTEEQTAGRGRRGRVWHAPARRALLMSVVLAAPALAAQLAYVPILAGLAARDAIAAHIGALGPRILIKWPNDIIYLPVESDPTGARKLGGMLVESVTSAGVPYAVIGLGINVNQTPAELPPVEPPALVPASLASVCGQPLDRTELARSFCRHLEKHLVRLGDAGAAAVAALIATWRQHLAFMHQPVQIYPQQGESFAAMAHDVTTQGELVVVDLEGTRHTLTAADVSIRPRTA